MLSLRFLSGPDEARALLERRWRRSPIATQLCPFLAHLLTCLLLLGAFARSAEHPVSGVLLALVTLILARGGPRAPLRQLLDRLAFALFTYLGPDPPPPASLTLELSDDSLALHSDERTQRWPWSQLIALSEGERHLFLSLQRGPTIAIPRAVIERSDPPLIPVLREQLRREGLPWTREPSSPP